MDEVEDRSAELLVRNQPERALDRGADVRQASLGIEDDDDVVEVLDQPARILLAIPEGIFRALAPNERAELRAHDGDEVDEPLVLLAHLVHVEDEYRHDLVGREHRNRNAGLEAERGRVRRARERLILIDVRHPHRLLAHPRAAGEPFAPRQRRDARDVTREQVGAARCAECPSARARCHRKPASRPRRTPTR